MLKKSTPPPTPADLFRSQLINVIDMRHRLVKLSGLIDWRGLDESLSPHFCAEKGRPAHSIRLMCGLLLLKEIEGVSDEGVVERWVENPYWQYFCGEEYFQHKFPMDASNLVHFRHRIGEEGMERLLQETVVIGLKVGVITPNDLKRVTMDSTVQEKAIRYPTDTHLYHKARLELVKLAEKMNVSMRQSYTRLSKEAVFMANKSMASRKVKQGRAWIKKGKNYLGRVIRNIEREISGAPHLQEIFAAHLQKARQIFNQQRCDSNKLYSWHAPEVECIAKGKASKPYEFGCKANYTTTNKSNFVIGAQAKHGKPYDGKILQDGLQQIAKITGVIPERCYVDQGYKKHGVTTTTIFMSRQKRGITPQIKRELKRRNAIEPIIGHMKHDGGIGARNYLKGIIGDKNNAILIAVGFNLRKILRFLLLCLINSWRLLTRNTMLTMLQIA